MARPDVEIPAEPQSPYPILVQNTNVVAGFGRGSSEIGIPTANIPVDDVPGLDELQTGVYFGFVRLRRPEEHKEHEIKSRLDGKSNIEFTYGEDLSSADFEVLPMVMSLGWNPFFKNKRKACELHIMHKFKSNFYGCRLSFNILGYIRPELDYVSMEALIEDIKIDIRTGLEWLEKEGYARYKGQLQ